jgi:Fic family protein
MRFPQSPPAWQPLLDRAIQQGRADAFMEFSHQENLRADRYLHWDDFRHRAAGKDGLSKEEQWAAIRMGRAMRSQPIPLLDTQGRHFTFFLTSAAFGLLREIDLHCGVGPSESAVVREETSRHQFDSLMEEALTSSQLEGAVVTRSEAREMIRSQRPPTTEHERMVMNNYRTMRLLTELREQPLTPEMILRIHREVTAGTLKDSGREGQLRGAGDDVRVEDEESGEVFHTPPDAADLHARMMRLCEFANETGMTGFLHPVVRSIVLHFWIAYDHPFVDGNGRTARALFYWSMLRNGYWLAEYFSISHEILRVPKKYYRAFLHTETDGNDLNYFLLHQLEVICDSIKSLRESIRAKQEEAESLRRNLGVGGEFNHRQIALLKHALKHPFAAYTVVGHQTSHGTSNQTAKNDIAALEAKGLLERGKVGKAFVYSPAPDLAGKLGLGNPL